MVSDLSVSERATLIALLRRWVASERASTTARGGRRRSTAPKVKPGRPESAAARLNVGGQDIRHPWRNNEVGQQPGPDRRDHNHPNSE